MVEVQFSSANEVSVGESKAVLLIFGGPGTSADKGTLEKTSPWAVWLGWGCSSSFTSEATS